MKKIQRPTLDSLRPKGSEVLLELDPKIQSQEGQSLPPEGDRNQRFQRSQPLGSLKRSPLELEPQSAPQLNQLVPLGSSPTREEDPATNEEDAETREFTKEKEFVGNRNVDDDDDNDDDDGKVSIYVSYALCSRTKI